MRSAVVASEVRLTVESDIDVVTARMRGRTLAAQMGFPPILATIIATTISELARNILQYARSGEIVLRPVEVGSRLGLAVEARDDGPGIPDIGLAMQDGFSTAGRLGLGLPGVRRLMDEFEIHSISGSGTMVRVRKWLP